MLHAKSHNHRTISSVGKIFEGLYHIYNWRGGHLGHVIIYIYYFPRRLHIKFGLIGGAVLEKKIFENGGHIHVHSSGANVFINTFSQSIESYAACFPIK